MIGLDTGTGADEVVGGDGGDSVEICDTIERCSSFSPFPLGVAFGVPFALVLPVSSRAGMNADVGTSAGTGAGNDNGGDTAREVDGELLGDGTVDLNSDGGDGGVVGFLPSQARVRHKSKAVVRGSFARDVLFRVGVDGAAAVDGAALLNVTVGVVAVVVVVAGWALTPPTTAGRLITSMMG